MNRIKLCIPFPYWVTIMLFSALSSLAVGATPRNSVGEHNSPPNTTLILHTEDPAKEDETKGFAPGSAWTLDFNTMQIVPGESAYGSANKRNLPFDVPVPLLLENLPVEVIRVDLCIQEMNGTDIMAKRVARLPEITEEFSTTTIKGMDDVLRHLGSLEEPTQQLKEHIALLNYMRTVFIGMDHVNLDWINAIKSVHDELDKLEIQAKRNGDEVVRVKLLTALEELDKIIHAWEVNCSECQGGSCAQECTDCFCISTWSRAPGALQAKPVVTLPPLKPNRSYRLCFKFISKVPEALRTTMVDGVSQQMLPYLTRVMGSLQDPVTAQGRAIVLSRYVSDFTDQVKDTLQAMAWAAGYKNIRLGNRNLRKRMETDMRRTIESVLDAYNALSREGPEDLPFANRDPYDQLLNAVFETQKHTAYLSGTQEYNKEDLTRSTWGWSVENLSTLKRRIAAIAVNIERLQHVQKTSNAADQKMINEVLLPKAFRNKRLFETLQARMDAITPAMATTLAALDLQLQSETVTWANTAGTFKTRATWYLAPDIGAAYVLGKERPADFATFYGLQFHPWPINREVPYSIFKGWGDPTFTRHPLLTALSFNIGLTTNKFVESDTEYKGVIDDRIGLMLGAGLRLTEMIRLVGGTVMTRHADQEPLSTSDHLHFNGFIGLTLDFDLSKYIQDLGAGRVAKHIPETP